MGQNRDVGVFSASPKVPTNTNDCKPPSPEKRRPFQVYFALLVPISMLHVVAILSDFWCFGRLGGLFLFLHSAICFEK